MNGGRTVGIDPARPPVVAVTTTDLLKIGGIVFFVLDHYGLFFQEDDPEWWRVFGRMAAPIFFFLIGYARTRTVPISWLAIGAVLTGLDYGFGEDDWTETELNILFNFAALRLALPWIERVVLPERWRTALFAAALIAVLPWVGPHIEYGAEGWLWALFGLLWRRHRDGVDPQPTDGILAAALAAIVYLAVEYRDLELDVTQGIVLALLLTGLVPLLLAFRRRALDWTLPPPVGSAIRYCGRHSLEIYGATVAAMQIGSELIG